MDNHAIDMDTYNDESIFNINELKDDDMVDELLKGEVYSEDDEDEINIGNNENDKGDDDDDEYNYEEELEDQIEEMYRQYKAKRDEHEKYLLEHGGVDTKSKGHKLKKEQEQAVLDKLFEERVEGNEKEYYELLNKKSDDSDSDEEGDDNKKNSLIKEISFLLILLKFLINLFS